MKKLFRLRTPPRRKNIIQLFTQLHVVLRLIEMAIILPKSDWHQ